MNLDNIYFYQESISQIMQDFLIPVEKEFQSYFQSLMKRSVGENVYFYEGELPEFKNAVALLHVPEYRGAKILEKSSDALLIRRSLYQLTEISKKELLLIDMGDLKLGAKLSDTKAALKCVCEELFEKNIIPLIIGGSHDLTLPQVQSFRKSNKGLNLLLVDQKVNFFDTNNEETNDENFLMELFSSKEINLFDFNHLGHQMHFTCQEALHTLDKLNYEAYRLAELQDNIENVEPLTRDADLLSFDMSAIRYSDAKGVLDPSPNGFFGHQACQVMRYAGHSHRLNSIGIYGIDTDSDEKGQTAQLIAQMIWYYLEAKARCKNEFPDFELKNFVRYSVNVEGTDGEIVFLKSSLSEKWWMEIPDFREETELKKYVIPCSYADYQIAANNEIPDRWMKAVNKFN